MQKASPFSGTQVPLTKGDKFAVVHVYMRVVVGWLSRCSRWISCARQRKSGNDMAGETRAEGWGDAGEHCVCMGWHGGNMISTAQAVVCAAGMINDDNGFRGLEHACDYLYNYIFD